MAEYTDHSLEFDAESLEAIGKSRANGKSDYIRDGKYLFEVIEHKYFKGDSGPTFVASLRVIESSPKGDYELAPFVQGQPHVLKEPRVEVVPNPPGSVIGWIQLRGKFKSSDGNIKGYALALAGKKEADVTPQELAEGLKAIISSAQPAKGVLIEGQTYRQVTRSGAYQGRMNVYLSFKSVPRGAEDDPRGNHPKQIAARRKAQGG